MIAAGDMKAANWAKLFSQDVKTFGFEIRKAYTRQSVVIFSPASLEQKFPFCAGASLHIFIIIPFEAVTDYEQRQGEWFLRTRVCYGV